MSEPYVAVQVPMMPRDTNRHGTIFGAIYLIMATRYDWGAFL